MYFFAPLLPWFHNIDYETVYVEKKHENLICLDF